LTRLKRTLSLVSGSDAVDGSSTGT
jgi:hypothetical protein